MLRCVMFAVLFGAALLMARNRSRSPAASRTDRIRQRGLGNSRRRKRATCDHLRHRKVLSRPVPTNDWWSSLAWIPLSERQYPHPLAVCAGPAGLRVDYPGPRIHADKSAIFGFMLPDKCDLTLGHSAQPSFAEARVSDFSDWFVSAQFGERRTRA